MREQGYRWFRRWYSCLLLALTLGWSFMLAAMPQAQLETVKLSDGRFYVLYVPSSLPSSAAAPLVLMFHGGGGHAEQAAQAYGWQATADKYGFVLVFPNGSSRLPRARLATWNAGNCCGYARDEHIDDVAFVRQVIADVQRRVAVDPQRIFATGMSNGAMLSQRLACEMSDTFRAIAAVAGTDNTRQCPLQQPLSVLLIHAKDDTHVLYQGGAGKDAFRDDSKVTDFTSVPATLQRWRQRLQLSDVSAQTSTQPGAAFERYKSQDGRIELQLISTDTGGHSWPGSKPVRGKTPSTAIAANEQIWQFFARQR
ncbi:MAG TPA: poly(3-hydroxybutyrate) depolymerase [Rheinheimera sp.]|nr:poly(3-hydroxybutyrate) depolymerase [Rheinheimera sp.]